MSNPRTPGCDSEENEFAKQGGITNGAAWSVSHFSGIVVSLFWAYINPTSTNQLSPKFLFFQFS